MKKMIMAAVFALMAAAGFAQQSFFIAPGQTIRNGDIARGYCLEYSKAAISNQNLAALTQITGDALVTFANGTSVPQSLESLISRGLVRFRALNSYQHLQFIFDSKSGIVELRVNAEGIGLFREKMTNSEEEMTRKNRDRILDLETRGLVHSLIQEIVWKTRVTSDDPVEGVRTIDFQTTDDPAEQVRARLAGNATVDYTRDGRKFMRLDGILNGTEDFSPEITELVSHFHNDHISLAALENLLRTVNFAGLYAPNVTRDDSRKNQAFTLLKGIENAISYSSRQDNPILRIPGANLFFLPALSNGSIGDFYYYTFGYDIDTEVVIFKYKKPRDPNSDGLIYQIAHKNVGYLLFGDFDDPAGIENLLDASVENEKKQGDLQEQRAALFKQLYENRDERNVLIHIYLDMLPEDGENAAPDEDALFRVTVLERRIAELQSTINSLDARIGNINKKIAILPVVKADVVKWPHHAHIFRESDSRDVIIKLNEVVNPAYFIYQVHSAQDLKNFEAYIKDFDFEGKFINSGDQPVEFISLKWLRTQFLSLLTGKQGKAS